MGILSWIVVGSIAGFFAGVMRGGGRGVMGDIIVGVIGSMLAGWIGSTSLHINTGIYVINLVSILVALGGAELLILILRKGAFWGDTTEESERQLG